MMIWIAAQRRDHAGGADRRSCCIQRRGTGGGGQCSAGGSRFCRFLGELWLPDGEQQCVLFRQEGEHYRHIQLQHCFCRRKPASSSGKQEAAYETEVKALLKQLYSVKARAESELNSCIAGAKAEYKALPESQQTQARKISIALARSGRLYAMQASYDKEVENIVSQMRTVLTANGQSTALADQAMASYKAQKSAMYSQLTAKLYS